LEAIAHIQSRVDDDSEDDDSDDTDLDLSMESNSGSEDCVYCCVDDTPYVLSEMQCR